MTDTRPSTVAYSTALFHRALPPSGPLHPSFNGWFQVWQQIRDCVAGQKTVKSLGELYLPKNPGMDEAEYRTFLQRASFYNAGRRTVEGLMGSIFRRPTEVLRPSKKLNFDKITKDRQRFEALVKKVAEEVITVGRHGVLLDRPALENSPPYFAPYTAEQILNWRVEERDGEEKLTQVVLSERASRIPDHGFGLEYYDRLRILELDELGQYTQRVTDADDPHGGVTIVPMARGVPLDFIPFVFFGPKTLGAEIEAPPIQDIVDLNISHYQSTADLQNARHYTATPVYYVTGASEDESVFEIGPNRVWKIDTNDKVGIVEYNGSGLNYLESAVNDFERQMFSLGGKLLSQQRKVAAQSDTMLELLKMGEEAILMSITDNLSFGFTTLVGWMTWWETGSEGDCEIRLNQQFDAVAVDARELRAIQSLYESGLVPVDIMYVIFRNAGVVPVTVSLEDFRKLLKEPGQVPEQQPNAAPGFQAKPVIPPAMNHDGKMKDSKVEDKAEEEDSKGEED